MGWSLAHQTQMQRQIKDKTIHLHSGQYWDFQANMSFPHLNGHRSLRAAWDLHFSHFCLLLMISDFLHRSQRHFLLLNLFDFFFFWCKNETSGLERRILSVTGYRWSSGCRWSSWTQDRCISNQMLKMLHKLVFSTFKAGDTHLARASVASCPWHRSIFNRVVLLVWSIVMVDTRVWTTWSACSWWCRWEGWWWRGRKGGGRRRRGSNKLRAGVVGSQASKESPL